MKRIKEEFKYAVHNLIAHPLLVVTLWLSLFGIIRPILNLGNWFHRITS